MASGSFDQTVRVWDVETGRQLAVLDLSGGASSGMSPFILRTTPGWPRPVPME